MLKNLAFRAALPLTCIALAACSGSGEPAPEDPRATATPSPAIVTAPAPTAPSTGPSVEQTVPAQFLGVWDAITGSCNPSSDLRMEIGSQAIGFYESHGQVMRVEVDNPERIVVSLAMEGEGEKWQMARQLTLSDEGRMMTAASVGDEQYEPLQLKRCDKE